MLAFPLVNIIEIDIFNAKKLKLFKGQFFSNAVNVMLFISDAQFYVIKIIQNIWKYTFI